MAFAHSRNDMATVLDSPTLMEANLIGKTEVVSLDTVRADHFLIWQVSFRIRGHSNRVSIRLGSLWRITAVGRNIWIIV